MSFLTSRYLVRGAAALTVALSLVASVPRGEAKSSYWTRSKEIAPGVVWTRINFPGGPNRVHVVSVELSRASTIDVMLAADMLPGFERTSSMASRSGALAAINGDYARSNGRPVFHFARDGILEQTRLAAGRNFALNRSETMTFMDFAKARVWLTDAATGAETKINRVNAGAPAFDEMNLYTMSGGSAERPPKNACSIRLYRTAGPRMRSPEPGVSEDYYVESKPVCRSSRLWPRGGVVLATPWDGARAAEIQALVPGQQFTMSWSLGSLVDVVETLGGNPTLIENGVIAESNVTGSGGFFGRHPRTGVGSTPDGRLLFVTVDGRQKGYSVGMNLRRFAKLFQSLGADWALNLDGGGSTTMWVDGRVRNRPSDGGERGVSSALVLLPGSDAGEAPLSEQDEGALPVLPLRPPLPEFGYWDLISSDPASTGGLADALLREGVRLPPDLARAAARFRSN